MAEDVLNLKNKLENAEESYLTLKKKSLEIPNVQRESLKAINQKIKVFEEILKYSKGTSSEKGVYKEIDALREKQIEISAVFSEADKEVKKELSARLQEYSEAEEIYYKAKEKSNENNV